MYTDIELRLTLSDSMLRFDHSILSFHSGGSTAGRLKLKAIDDDILHAWTVVCESVFACMEPSIQDSCV